MLQNKKRNSEGEASEPTVEVPTEELDISVALGEKKKKKKKVRWFSNCNSNDNNVCATIYSGL